MIEYNYFNYKHIVHFIKTNIQFIYNNKID